MKYFLVVGERSGDLHASKLISQIKNIDPDADFQYYGGDLMENEAEGLMFHYKNMAFMGFWEVIKNYGALKRIFNNCLNDIKRYEPDALILVDFSGFNMRLAKRLSGSDFDIFYYIAPKVWAWNQSRAHKIRKYVNRLYTILPFETSFFDSYDVNSLYVGNPLVERIDEYIRENTELERKENQIAILPGSRYQEVSAILQLIIQVVPSFGDYSFVVAGVDNLDQSVYEPVEKYENVSIEFGDTYNVLVRSKAAIVTSGTATLETALLNVPQIVCYKTSPLSYLIGRAVIKVKYISLVNLIADKEVVKELIQNDLNKANLVSELKAIIKEGTRRDSVLRGYREVRNKLGDQSSSEIVASDIKRHLLSKNQATLS